MYLTVLLGVGVLLVAALLLAVVGVVLIYNSLVALRQKVAEAKANIDVALKKRADLITQMVKVVREYAKHERGLYLQIARQKKKMVTGSLQERMRASDKLGELLGRLFALAEAYPELKASENYRELQEALTSVENDLARSRQAYNEAVRRLNTAVRSFPANLIAAPLGFTEEEFLEVEVPEGTPL